MCDNGAGFCHAGALFSSSSMLCIWADGFVIRTNCGPHNTLHPLCTIATQPNLALPLLATAPCSAPLISHLSHLFGYCRYGRFSCLWVNSITEQTDRKRRAGDFHGSTIQSNTQMFKFGPDLVKITGLRHVNMSHTIYDCGVTLHAKHEANVDAGNAVLLVKFIEN